MHYVVLNKSEFIICEECVHSTLNPLEYFLKNVTMGLFIGKEQTLLKNFRPSTGIVHKVFTNAQDAVDYVATQYIIDFDDRFNSKANQKRILQELI